MRHETRAGFTFEAKLAGCSFTVTLAYDGSCPNTFRITLSGHTDDDAGRDFSCGSPLSLTASSSLFSRVDQVLECVDHLTLRPLDAECLHLLSDSLSSWMFEGTDDRTDRVDARRALMDLK